MQKHFLFFIFGISFLFACKQKEETKPLVKIPNIEISSADSAIAMQQDLMTYRSKLYSGFVVEKYPNGQLAAKNGFVNGKLEGMQLKWYPDGSKMEARAYTANRKDGKHLAWWPNGKRKFLYLIENDTPVGVHYEWYEDGKLYALNSYNKEGQPEGKQQMCYDNGQIKSNYVIKEGRRFGFLGAKGCMGEGEKKATGLKFEK